MVCQFFNLASYLCSPNAATASSWYSFDRMYSLCMIHSVYMYVMCMIIVLVGCGVVKMLVCCVFSPHILKMYKHLISKSASGRIKR